MRERVELRSNQGRRFAYSGSSLLVTDSRGRVTGAGVEGFYFESTRLLSRLLLSAGGTEIVPFAASPAGANRFLAYGQVADVAAEPEPSVYLEQSCLVDEGLAVGLRLENCSPHEVVAFELAVALDADFADIEEAAGGDRRQVAPVDVRWDEQVGQLEFRYGHPQLDRAVVVSVTASFAPRWDGHHLRFPVELSPHRPEHVELVAEPLFGGVRRRTAGLPIGHVVTPLDRLRAELRERAPTVATSNATVAKAWQRAVDDLASLPLGLPEGPAAPIAGLPRYQQFFGRDTLSIGGQAALAMPTMLRDALVANAAMQGRAVDDWRDEEPGKMIHQARTGPLSALGEDPFLRYYGDYSTSLDFVVMLGAYLSWTGDRQTVARLLPAARAALTWAEQAGDLDGDGFLEYQTRSPKGMKNQGWKDSGNAIVDQDGKVVDSPIATCEVQGYWYAALRQAALLFLLDGQAGYAARLWRRARSLKRRFDEAFWMEDSGFYAMALGADKRPVRSLASNAGHLLLSGIVPPDKGRRVALRLMEDDLFSGWGVRTLSSSHPAYNPFSYHLGSVWPVENGTLAYGFARYRCVSELHRLAEAVFASTELFPGNRLPEALGGIPRDGDHPHPGIYPQANDPHGWSVSSVVLTLQALLGLRPVAPLGLLLVDPVLPEWLPDLELRGVGVGAARVDLRFWRTRRGRTAYRVMGRDGRLRVLRRRLPWSP